MSVDLDNQSSSTVSSDAITDDEDIVLELRNASVTFDMDRGQSRVLDRVDLQVRRGEVLGVVGESGSGKSMCASAMIDAVIKPGLLMGEVIYYPQDDEPINLRELSRDELKKVRWEEIAFLVQAAQSAFNPTMSIREHFIETLSIHDYDVAEGMDYARELLEELYLSPTQVLDSHPHELSGGMKQRALIALSLVLQPEVLIMDEPTSALDLLMQRSIISLLIKLKEQYDLTLVFVTHDLPIVADIADRIAVMYAFEFVEIGPSRQITHHAGHPYTRALINSVPSVLAPIEEMRAIEGSSPDPVNVPKGCSYNPRCPLAEPVCSTDDPPFHRIGEEHAAKCFFWEDAAAEIPMTTQLHEDQ